MVNGDMVWACNLCDHGLNSGKEMQKHMKNEHDKVVNIEETIDDQHKNTEGVKIIMNIKW